MYTHKDRRKLIKKWHQYDTYRWSVEQTAHSILFSNIFTMQCRQRLCAMSTRIEYQSQLLLLQQHKTSGISWKWSTCNALKNVNVFLHLIDHFLIMTAFHIITYTFIIFIVSVLGFIQFFFKLFAFQCLHPPPSIGMWHTVRHSYYTLRWW